MILGFTKILNGKPTKFKEKILSSIGIKEYKDYAPKRHTIREDKTNRWKQGRMIQSCYGVRTKQFEKFAEMPCLGIQKIKITWVDSEVNEGNRIPTITVDGRVLNYIEECELAKNDGFNLLVDFYQWFNKDFEGKIIHWTNHIRY